VTEDSAFKKQVRARMAETGEKYTTARRAVLGDRDPDPPPAVLRVSLDVQLTDEAARAYAAADERGRRELAGRLLADQAAAGPAPVPADSMIVTDREPHSGAETAQAAEDAAIRDVVRRSVERAVGVSAVEVSRAADRLRVSIRAARPNLLAGPRGAEADRLRVELEELTGGRVRLDLREAPVPLEKPASAEHAG
jgi:hypothetical protein